MSEHPNKHSSKEHGTAKSYVIGFVLSLIFTIIPYYLVVNKVLSGNTLWVVILGIGVLQMFIQIFFFLHLGRGPKPLYNITFFCLTAGAIVIVVVASLFIMNNLYHNMTPDQVTLKLAQEENISHVEDKETGACQGSKESHVVTITNGKVDPEIVEAHRCDILTFINYDEKKRELVFGSHPTYEAYGGTDMLILVKEEPETMTLNQVGEYDFHDHLEPSVSGSFIVEE